MLKYILKRIALMLLTFIIIISICFVLIKAVPIIDGTDKIQNQIEAAKREALGYNKPVIVQLGIYLKNLFFNLDLGVSWKMDRMANVSDMIARKLPPTVIINVYSLIFSIPIGIALGILAALKKNKWQDHVISTVVMIFVSVPSFRSPAFG